MTIHLVQFRDGGERAAGIVEESRVRVLDGVGTVHALAGAALRRGTGLEAAARAAAGSRTLSYDELTASDRLLPPLDHPDPAHCLVSGTGLTHLGSAASAMPCTKRPKRRRRPTACGCSVWVSKGGSRPRDKPGFSPSGSTRATARSLSRRAAISRCRILRSMPVKRRRSSGSI